MLLALADATRRGTARAPMAALWEALMAAEARPQVDYS